MSLASRLLAGFRRRRHLPQDYALRFTDDGFEVVLAGDRVATVCWREVSRITTYKLDLLTTDAICLLFDLGPGAKPVQVAEEWSGFQDLFARLKEEFPTIPEDWYATVMQPAFERNETVLFERREG